MAPQGDVLHYPVTIVARGGQFDVVFPDFPDHCAFASSSREARQMAKQILHGILADHLRRGATWPRPSEGAGTTSVRVSRRLTWRYYLSRLTRKLVIGERPRP